MFSDALLKETDALIEACRALRLTLATAESCTGGLLAGLLTSIAGASDVFDRGFVTYSNAAKQELLGVSPETLARFGAVSHETARAMAEGVLSHSAADLSLSITGIAGPGGGSKEKPVGLVYFGRAWRHGEPVSVEQRFGEIGRDAVRQASLESAVALLHAALRDYDPHARKDQGALP
ncbi:MAG TPA: CinA family protein [Methylocella sp.]|nr:CinA family protein [Methylocella sp.]